MQPPLTEAELLARCRQLYGFSLAQLARTLGLIIPQYALQRKGWLGCALERALGAEAGVQSKPDFINLGIELKTLPLGKCGKSIESTFITSISLLSITNESWHTSTCWSKLRRVLWFAVEGDTNIPFAERRLGRAWLWSPSSAQEIILEQDWSMFVTMIALGKLNEINARMGTYLQIRPKAANEHSLCDYFDDSGHKSKTLPRGFYLRAKFTSIISQF